MASWVFCNRCFQPPGRASCFSLTSCGHVYCEACLSKGKKDECLICKVPCHTVLLSKHTSSEIQAFFMGIDDLCKKYSRETSQISEFQEKHRKRLLAFYREKISTLEESLRTSRLQMEELQSMRSSQQAAFSTIRQSLSTPSEKPGGRLWQPLSSVGPDRVESMDVDLPASLARRPEIATGPTRISLISPPQDGRMGSVSHWGPQHLSLTPSQTSVSSALRIPPLHIPYKGLSQTPTSQLAGRVSRGGSPCPGSSQAGPPSQAPAPRQPISIPDLMRRQCSGKCPAHSER